MQKDTSTIGDILDAIDSASDQELRLLQGIRGDIRKLQPSNMRITRSNAKPGEHSEKPELFVLRDVLRELQTQGRNSSSLNAAALARNQSELKSPDRARARAAAERIVHAPTRPRTYNRDLQGRFVSPKRLGGNDLNIKVTAPKQPKPDSLFSKGDMDALAKEIGDEVKKYQPKTRQSVTKSQQQEARNIAAAQREFEEEQNQETLQRQDTTNQLLRNLLKEERKKKPLVSGGTGGGLDINVGRGGLFKRLRDRITGRARGKGGKAGIRGKAAGAAEDVTDNMKRRKGAASSSGDAAEKKAGGAGRDASGRFIKKGAEEATSKAEKRAVRAVAEKVGTKALLGTAVRAVPVIGTVLGAGFDAVGGYSDNEGQQNAFTLKKGQEASTRQKTEYALANIVDMGGLVSGGSQLLSMGASAFGFDDAAKALDFSTEDMARGIDNIGTDVVKGVGDAWGDFKDVFTRDSTTTEKSADKRNDKLITAVEALGMQAGNPLYGGGANFQLGTFANDNPTQAALRHQRNMSAVEQAQITANELKYGGIVEKTAKEYGVESSDISTIIGKESSWDPTAASGTGPVGLGQISEGKAKDLGYSLDDRLDPQKNIEMTSKLWGKLLKRYHGNKKLALLAYNQWEGNADKVAKGGEISSDGAAYLERFNGTMGLDKYSTTAQVDTKAGAIGDGNSKTADQSKMMKAYGDFKDIFTAPNETATKLLAAHRIGHFGQKPSKELTMPAGATVPDALKVQPHQLAQLQDQNGTVLPADATAPYATSRGNQYSLSSPAAVSGSPLTNAGKGLTLANAPEAFTDIVRNAGADTIQNMTAGMSGGGVMSVLTQSLPPQVQGMLAPLTGMLGNQLESAISSGRDALTGLIRGTPDKPALSAPVTPEAGGTALNTLNAPTPDTVPAPDVGTTIEDVLRGATGDTFKNATAGISGSGIMSAVTNTMNPQVASILQPLTGAVGNGLDSMIGAGRSSVMGMLSGGPAKPKSVTDLSASSVTETVSRDASTQADNSQSNDLLSQIADHIQSLIGITKDSQKKDSEKQTANLPTGTNQPMPNANIPMQATGSAFEEMIRGLF